MHQRSRRRGRFRLALAALGLAALVIAGHRAFLRARAASGSPAPAPAPAPAAGGGSAEAPPGIRPALDDLTLTAAEGAVEIRRGKVAPYEPAVVGTALAARDDLRTGDGRATLSARPWFEVQVEPGTELSVEELNARLSRIGLSTGMLVASVEGGGERSLVVRAADSDARAVAREGTFAMSNNGRGTVAVGARSGELEFQAAGGAVVLRAGQVSIAQGGVPQPPASVPSSLFLKIRWPPSLVRRRQILVAGQTAPGAVLVVGGVPTRVEKDGSFEARLTLREGKNRLRAEGVDVAGHRALESAAVEVDTTAPDSVIRTEGLWRR